MRIRKSNNRLHLIISTTLAIRISGNNKFLKHPTFVWNSVLFLYEADETGPDNEIKESCVGVGENNYQEDEDDYNSDDDTTSEEARAEAAAREQGLRSLDGDEGEDEDGYTYCCRDDDGMWKWTHKLTIFACICGKYPNDSLFTSLIYFCFVAHFSDWTFSIFCRLYFQ